MRRRRGAGCARGRRPTRPRLVTGEPARRLGYLLKERVGRVEQFLEALHRVADGGTAIDPDVVAQLFARRPPRSWRR